MLGDLRRKFIVITMALVGAVLAVILSWTTYSSWRINRQEIDRALEMALSGDQAPAVGIGRQQTRTTRDMDGGPFRYPVLIVNIIDSDVYLDANTAYIEIDLDDLNEIVDNVEGSSLDTGHIQVDEAHLSWRRQSTASGWRVAVADVTTIDHSFRTQILSDITLLLIALMLLYGIARYLARWALQPVEEAWDAQKRFVADASHELKTPLSVVLANTQILQSHIDELDPEAQHWVESTAEEARSMRDLVEDLLELARTEESQEIASGRAITETVNFSDLVQTIALQFDAVAFEKGCIISTTVVPDITVEGNSSQLDRLTTILIDNACKYADKDTEVLVDLKLESGHPTLRVTNFGDIISKEDIPHLFERFYRSDTVRTKSGSGSYGLGLAIAKAIVDSHSGTIEVTSSAQAGNCFTVTL